MKAGGRTPQPSAKRRDNMARPLESALIPIALDLSFEMLFEIDVRQGLWYLDDDTTLSLRGVNVALKLAYKVRTYSSGTAGRAICNARHHHFIADDGGGEEVGAGELFLSGIAACAVNMVERLARQGNIPLQWMDVEVESHRDADKPPGEVLLYDAIRVRFEMWGVQPAHAEALVKDWKRL